MKRRKFIHHIGLGSTILFIPLMTPHLRLAKGTRVNNLENRQDNSLRLRLSAVEDEVQILPGNPTRVWRFKGDVLNGPADSLVVTDSYPGPIIKAHKGDLFRAQFVNQIEDESIIHWHGLHVPEKQDGHPRYVINKGEVFDYEFRIMNRAGTYWFHPHPHGKTGPQVYRGLAGLFIVTDENEQKLNLPEGDYDIPLVIQDRLFDDDNQLVYLDRSMMDRMMGFLGNRIVVNGKADSVFPVETRPYRVRLLNGSNARIYKLSLNNGKPFTVIGTDGGLLEKPVTRQYLMMGPGERYDIWIDFSDENVGNEIVLKSLPFNTGEMGMMGRGMMRRNRQQEMTSELPNGSEFDICKMRVVKSSSVRMRLPESLSILNFPGYEDAVNKENPRQFEFAMGMRMQWMINGRTFEMTGVAENEKVKLNTTEVWKFINGSVGRRGMMGMMGNMMQMPHPVHVHGLQFKIIGREVDDFDGWDTVKDGFVDEGWKDTFLLMPRTKVKVLLRFENYEGLFLYHCHNLEHEDMGMMRNYLIEA